MYGFFIGGLSFLMSTRLIPQPGRSRHRLSTTLGTASTVNAESGCLKVVDTARATASAGSRRDDSCEAQQVTFPIEATRAAKVVDAEQGAYCVCPHPGDVAARPVAEAGGPRHPYRPTRPPASAALDAAPRGVVAQRARPDRARRMAHPSRCTQRLPGRHRPPHGRGCRCLTLASRHGPRPAAHPPAPLAGGTVRDPFLRRTRPFGGRIWTFSRVEGRRVTGRESVAHPALSYRAAVRVPWARFLPPLSEPGVPISGTGLSSGIMRFAHGLAGCDQRAGLASRGTRLTPWRWPAGASSDLLTP